METVIRPLLRFAPKRSRFAAGLLMTVLWAQNLCACTVFFAYDGKLALAGDSEDWLDPNTQVWFVPATKDHFGIMYFGFGTGEYPKDGIRMPTLKLPEGGITKIEPSSVYGFPQAGMNDQGLFFGGAATDTVQKAIGEGKKIYLGFLVDRILRKCKNVTEASKILQEYSMGLPQGQILFADKTGDSIIVEAGDVQIRKSGNHQVITNFRLSQTSSEEISCPRYKSVDELLSQSKKFSVATARQCLEVVAASAPPGTKPDQLGVIRTQYSLVCDLTHSLCYVYLQGDFTKAHKIDVKKELRKGEHCSKVADLFR